MQKEELLQIIIIIIFLFVEISIKAQYPHDSVAVEYEVLSIKKAKQAHISYLNEEIKKLKKDKERYERTVLILQNYKKEIRRSKELKLGFILTLRNNQGGYFDVVTVKTKSTNGEKVKAGKIYKIKLEKYYERTIAPRIGLVFEATIDDVKIRVVGQSWTGNIYVTSDLKGLYYIRCNKRRKIKKNGLSI